MKEPSKKRRSVNKIAKILELRKANPAPVRSNLRVVVSDVDTGEVLYDWKSKAGIFVSIEDGKWDQKSKTVEGKQQYLAWGHPSFVWYAFDQLTKKFRAGDGPFAKVLAFLRGERDSLLSDLLKDV